jgi:hypothetical protein
MSALEAGLLACLYVLILVAVFGVMAWIADAIERRTQP